jgi:type IV pilus assembly protein PilW
VKTKASLMKASRGFTMVELLISITLGLVLLIAVTSVFLGSRQSFRTQEGMAQVQETGRLLSYLMYPYVRLAGYMPDPLNISDPSLIFDSTVRALTGTNDSAPTIPGIASSSVLANTDSITVRYLSSADPALSACNGATYTSGLVENTFYVGGQDSNGVWSLMCKVRNIATDASHTVLSTPTPQPLLLGIRDMQILYGVDADTDMVADRFFTAAAVTDWTRISSIRITMQVESADNALPPGTSGAGVTSSGRITRPFVTTIQIRNRLRA